jgi:MFS family permease
MGLKKDRLAAISGNTIEFYDFVVYSFFATYIGDSFFPASSPVSGLLNALAVFATGFAARPVGAFVLGRHADRHGRRPAMVISMALITGATLSMALLPGYKHIGAWAPVLLVLCRIVQGFALGGEAGPATAYLLESAPAGRTARTCSWFLAGQGAATFIAGVAGTLATSMLTPEQMREWGWRLPFLLSALLAPCILAMRRHMPEAAVPPEDGQTVSRADHAHAHAPRGRTIVLFSIALIGGTAANYMCSYLSTFAIRTLSMPPSIALSAAMVVGATTFSGALAGGWLSDRVGERRVLLWSRFCCTLLALPACEIVVRFPSVICLWSVAALLSIANGINGGVLFSTMGSAFGRQGRATSLSLVYACGVALFGGASQFFVTSWIETTGVTTAPGIYILATGSIACIALLLVLRRPPAQAPALKRAPAPAHVGRVQDP